VARHPRTNPLPDVSWKILAVAGAAAILVDLTGLAASASRSLDSGLGLTGLILLTLAWLAHVASTAR